MSIARLLSLALCFVGAASPAAAFAAAREYPTKPIRFIIPNNPGSSVDVTGRIFATALGEALGQQLIPDNRGGAGGAIGMELGKDANPDGHTLIWASTAAMTIRPHLRLKLPYDPMKDYEFITFCGVTPNVLVVNPATPPHSVKAFLAWVKANPGKLNMASAGVGSQSHLAGTALAVAAGLDPLHVPYKGGGSSVAATIAGESLWTFTPAPAVMGHIRSGRLRALGQSLPQSSPIVEGIPPIAATVPKFEYSGWLGLLAPRGTPKPVIEKIRSTAIKVLNSPAAQKRLGDQGVLVKTSTPEEFRRFVGEELVDAGKIVKAAGLKPE